MSFGILIIDDEPNLPHQFARFLRRRGFEVFTAPDGEAGLQELQRSQVDVLLLDLRLPRLSGLEVLKRLRTFETELPVIILTAYGDIQTAVEAMKLGASDYLLKGFDLEELVLVIQRALETSAMSRELRQLRRERGNRYHFDYIVGHSERMREVFEMVARVAKSDASVLILGESGTGKEVVAHAIHEQSERAAGPFYPLNCAAIASNLLESELFGYEQYAFTDAKKQKRGLLELADGGTLFLDELGEMPLEMQAKLLRVLETKAFFRLGGNREVRINVRILAATNRNLEQAMQNGIFRADLYFRLAVLKITLPPLRERPDDILLFATRFIEDFNASLGRCIRGISREAQEVLTGYHWPGNIRELKNVIERAVILSTSDELLPVHLPQEILYSSKRTGPSPETSWEIWLEQHPAGPIVLEEVLARTEQYFLRQAWELSKHNRPRASELLGLEKVDQLRYLMRKYGID